MALRSTLRASDADREQTAERLRKAAAEGRLLAEELEQRLGVAFAARTYGELDALVADLPDERPMPARSRAAVPIRGPVGLLAAVCVCAVAVALVALVITGTVLIGGAWIFFVMWFFGGRGARHRAVRHRRYPPGGGLHQVHGPADRQAWL